MRSLRSWIQQKKIFAERFVVGVIENKSTHFLHKLLYGLSILFKYAVVFRTCLYEKGWKQVRKSTLPVVCIGNITAGGTGKTPLVEKLAQDLKEDVKLAIISKGYRSLGVSKHDVISPVDSYNRSVDSIYCGDEPYLLKKHLADVEVLLSKDRELAIEVAKKRNIDVVLLDDGFQMKSLFKDLTLLVLHAKDLFGLGYYLPRGYLRESPHKLKEADLLCITQSYFDKIPFEELCEKIKPYSSAPVIGVHMTPKGVKGDLSIDLESLRGLRAGVFCGIGKPKSYLETLQALGVDVIKSLVMPDHCIPSLQELQKFSNLCKESGAEILLCTEKDFVKIVHPHYHLIPICYLETDVNIIYGKNSYEEFKKKIIALTKKR